jgi:GNT-I family
MFLFLYNNSKAFTNLGHYKWALDELFIKRNFTRVIILEGNASICHHFIHL